MCERQTSPPTVSDSSRICVSWTAPERQSDGVTRSEWSADGETGWTARHPRRDRQARAFFEAAVAAGNYPIATASGAATVTASRRGASLVSPAVLYQRLPTVIYDLAD